MAMYRIDYGMILNLPAGVRKVAIARKVLALRYNQRSTSFLETEFGIRDTKDVISLVEQIAFNEESFWSVDTVNPEDKTDGGNHEVDVPSFFAKAEIVDRAMARDLKERVLELMEEENWYDAAALALSLYYRVRGNKRRGAIKLLKKATPHTSLAALHYGRALVRGHYVSRNKTKGIELLKSISCDDDPLISGYANLVLGETLMTMPGMGYRALRHFESAAYLGWEDASEYAGVLCRMGSNGCPLDLDRAAKNFRYGISKGQVSCMSKYALMVATGELPYDPEWRRHIGVALHHQERMAMEIYPDLEVADLLSNGDVKTLVKEVRDRVPVEHILRIDPASYHPVIDGSDIEDWVD